MGSSTVFFLSHICPPEIHLHTGHMKPSQALREQAALQSRFVFLFSALISWNVYGFCPCFSTWWSLLWLCMWLVVLPHIAYEMYFSATLRAPWRKETFHLTAYVTCKRSPSHGHDMSVFLLSCSYLVRPLGKMSKGTKDKVAAFSFWLHRE